MPIIVVRRAASQALNGGLHREGERPSRRLLGQGMQGPGLHPRLAALPRREALGVEVPVARGPRSRLLGLAAIEREAAGAGLLIPRCAAVHTFGMRFPLDLFFLDERGEPLEVRRALAPRRFACRRGAAAVLELPGGEFPPPAH